MDSFEEELSIDRTGPDFLLEELEGAYSPLADGDAAPSSPPPPPPFADLRLVSSDGTAFAAHRAVLAPLSAFLRRLLLGADDEGAAVVVLPDVSAAAVGALLGVAYRGECVATVDNADALREAMSLLRVTREVQIVGEPPRWEEEDEDIEENEIVVPDMVAQTQEYSPSAPPSASVISSKRPSLSSSKRLQLPPSITVQRIRQFPPGVPPPRKRPRCSNGGELGPPTFGAPKRASNSHLSVRRSLPPGMSPHQAVARSVRPAAQDSCSCPNCAEARAQGIKVSGVHVCHHANCGRTYSNPTLLRSHLRTHASGAPAAAARNKPSPPPLPPLPSHHFACSWRGCQRKFAASQEMLAHFRTHTVAERRIKSLQQPQMLLNGSENHHGGGNQVMVMNPDEEDDDDEPITVYPSLS